MSRDMHYGIEEKVQYKIKLKRGKKKKTKRNINSSEMTSLVNEELTMEKRNWSGECTNKKQNNPQFCGHAPKIIGGMEKEKCFCREKQTLKIIIKTICFTILINLFSETSWQDIGLVKIVIFKCEYLN